MILVDTNVFSELTKPKSDDRVIDWLFAYRNETLLSTIIVAELTVGIRNTRGTDRRALLLPWLARLIARHEYRIVDSDLAAAQRWGAFAAEVLIADLRIGSRQFDTLLAAQALTLDVPLATRNMRDCDDLGLRLINPWGD